jgi:uncharacterized membrane protein YedE/YeeE
VKLHVSLGFVGLFLGFSLSRIGFASWDQVHAMFVFADLRLFLTFVSGVVALTAAWPVVARFATGKWPRRPIHPGILAGSVLFGVGWALCGACPAISLVQLGEGQLGAVFTLAGVFAGNWLYAVVHERYFRWTMRSCAEE